MAANTGVRTCHFTLGAAVADTVVLTDPEIIGFDVVLRSGTGPLWVTWAHKNAATAATVAGDETYSVTGTGNANALRVLFQGGRPLGEGNSLNLSVLSATADVVSVHGILAE